MFVAIGALVIKIQDHFAKNRDKKKPKLTVSVKPEQSGSGSFNRNDDDKKDKDKKQNLIYKSSDAHKLCQSGKKSAEPSNGQKALNKSFPIEGDTKQKISVCDGEIVVFKHTRNNVYHGYVVTWQDLNIAANKVAEAMKNILLKKQFGKK